MRTGSRVGLDQIEEALRKDGASKKDAEQLLQKLFDDRAKAQNEYDDLATKNPNKVETLDMIGVRQKRERIDNAISEIRDWYGLHVLEALEEESRRLKWLTVVLVALTAILAIFTGFLVTGYRVP